MKYLTELQIKKYEDDGFLLLKKFFGKEEMEPVIKSINKFSELPYNFWEVGKEMAYYETSNENKNERILNRVEKAVDYHPVFGKSEKKWRIMKQAMKMKMNVYYAGLKNMLITIQNSKNWQILRKF